MKLNENSWAVLSKDEVTCWVGLGSCRWSAKPEGLSFYFPDFFLENEEPYLLFDEVVEISKDELLAQLPDCSSNQSKWTEKGQDAFEEAFHSLDHLKKVVPYIGFHSTTPQEPLSYLKPALNYHLKYPHTTLYGFWDGKEGMVGATPEKLFTKDREQLQSEAVAGTLPIAQRALLLNDPKLHHEHQLVIEGIQSSLAPYASVQLNSTEIRDFGSLSHLVTPIEATMNKLCSLSTLVEALHPTPALGAYPKALGKSWLENYALQVPRLRYGAPIGLVDTENDMMKFYVAIRNVQFTKDHSAILAGCGIVKDSIISKELEEIQLKFNSIAAILGISK